MTETDERTIEATTRRLRTRLEEFVAGKPFKFNPDKELAHLVIEGLARNELKYGLAYCTCKIRQGVESEDKKIVCPCDFLAEEIEQDGTCGCALFVEDENAVVAAEGNGIWVYEPVARPKVLSVPLAPRLPTVEGQVIGLLDNAFWNSSNIIIDRLSERFAEQYHARLLTGKAMKWISHDPRRVGKVPDEVVEDMVANVHAAITMLGN